MATRPDDDLRPEYDLSRLKGGVRAKYYRQAKAGTNVVFLDPDVAKVFTDSAAVNQVLRLLVQLAKTNVPVETRPNKAQPTSRRRRTSKKPKTGRK